MSVLSIVKDAVSAIGGVADELFTSEEEKLQARHKLVEVQTNLAIELERAISSEVAAKKEVLVAELNQGDTYTKRARPTIVYAGLLIAIVNHIILPWTAYFVGYQPPNIQMPTEFWVGWSGIVGTWVIGRSAERRGLQSKMLSVITGSKGTST